MNIYNIYKLVNYVLNKDQFGRYMQVDQFNELVKAAEIDLFKYRYGLPQHYQPGMNIAAVGYEMTQKLSDDMSPFKVWLGDPSGLPLMVVDADGIAPKPKDYVHVSSVSTIQDMPVEVLFNMEFNQRLVNPNRKPSLKMPIATFIGDNIHFRPKDISYVNFTYLRLPKYAKLVVTIDTNNDVETYDPINSIDTEFPEDMFTEYVRRILSYVGVNLRNELLIQYSNAIEK